MKVLIGALFLILGLCANDGVHTFAENSACKVCHPLIYDEFSNSQHSNSTIYKDPIHNALWQKHPNNLKDHRYDCGKCHTPVANNLDKMLENSVQELDVAMPDAQNSTHDEAIGCAYCHRIERIQEGKKNNTNIISLEERTYFGTRNNHTNSPYHDINTTGNKHMQNGNVCAGCHSHNQNAFGLNICSSNSAKEINKANCVSCHMPKVEGSVSNIRKTPMHTYHGFPGTHSDNAMLADYIALEASKIDRGIRVTIQNSASHAMLLHPLRVGVLKVYKINAKGKKLLAEETFMRIIGKNKEPAMPWIADTTLKDTMLQAMEQRNFEYKVTLTGDDQIEVELGYFLVNPKAVSKLNLEDQEVATKFYSLKKELFRF